VNPFRGPLAALMASAILPSRQRHDEPWVDLNTRATSRGFAHTPSAPQGSGPLAQPGMLLTALAR
jgi:hypothetical protein